MPTPTRTQPNRNNNAPTRGQQPQRTQQSTGKQPRKVVAPAGTMIWALEIPLEGGGLIKVSANDNFDLIAAYAGISAVQRALKCPKCGATDINFGARPTQGENGEFMQYSAWCRTPGCGSGLAFNTVRNDKGEEVMLVGSYKDEYYDWYVPGDKTSTDNTHTSNNRAGNTPARDSASNGTGRANAPSVPARGKQQPQQAEPQEPDEPYETQDDEVPW